MTNLEVKPERKNESQRVESPKPHEEVPVIELVEEASPKNITPRLDIFKLENDSSFRSHQGSIRAHLGGDKVVKRGAKQANRRKGEIQGLDTQHLSMRSVQRGQFKGDSVAKPTGAEVENSTLKHIQSENGSSMNLSAGLTDADDQAEAFAALAAVMEVHGIPKVVVGLAADFPGDTGMYSNYQCSICKKPETAKYTIVCDKCQQSYHLICVELNPNQAMEKENEHWRCDSCGPELEGQYWGLGRITAQHDRKEADSKWDVSTSHADALERLVVILPAIDAAVEDDGNGIQLQTSPATRTDYGHGGAGNLSFKSARTKNEDVARLACKENVMPVKRGRGRPRKDSKVLKEQIITNATKDMGIQDSGLIELQPALNIGFLGLANSRKETKRRKDSNVQDTAQKLGSPINPVDLSVEGFRSSKEKLLSMRRGELVEVSKRPIVKNIPFVKESRTHPPAGELLTRRIPAELVGDTLQVWEFLCRFSDVLGWTSLTYEELESGLVNLGPPLATDTILDVKIRDSLDLRSRKDSEKNCAVAGRGSLSEHGGARPGVPLENGPYFACESDGLKAEGSGCVRTSLIAHGLKQDTTTGQIRNPPQRTAVHEISNRTIGPADSPGLEVSATEVAVAFSDGMLNEHFVMMSTTHILLLKLLLADLQFRISGTPNVNKSEEPKKKGRKPLYEVPQVPQDVTMPEFPNDLPINEVTWPELVRRYLITVVEVEKYGDLTELKPEERKWLMRCLQGDGGVPCGALYTVVGVESDAQVLVEAEKELAVRLPNVDEVGEELDDPVDEFDKLPQWVEALKPVMKMATNVGSRIRTKVKEALELGPPEWARDTLKWSISKEVFKSNASGPTKKAIIEVLTYFNLSPSCDSPNYKTKTKKMMPSVDELMQRCRVVLRTLADADKTDTFSILIGPEGHGSRRLHGMVARPLDFRTIDARLAAGAYGGSVDAFAEDVRQIWRNVESLQKGGDVMQLASDLSQIFEELLQKQVLNFMNGIPEVNVDELKIDEVNAVEEGKDIDLFSRSVTAENPDENKLQRAPWQDTDTCRVCGVDEDYESIMLCDKCDAEYHTYCLNPPLERVPEGTWFCPECVALDKVFPDRLRKDGELVGTESLEGEEDHCSADRNMDNPVQTKHESAAERLLKQVELKEYWQLGLSERIYILKFLCEESLKTTELRTHLEKSVELAYDLQQQLSALRALWEGSVIAIDEKGKQRKKMVENLKSRPHSVTGTEAARIDSWSISLKQHSSAVVDAEDITPALPRLLNFDVDGDEYENAVERDTTIMAFLDSDKAGKGDTVSVSSAIHENHKSNEQIKIEDASNGVIASNNLINHFPSSADLSVAVLNCTVNAMKRKHCVGAQEGDLMAEVGSRIETASENVTTRNSKQAKFEEYNEDAQPAVEVMNVTAALNQTVNVYLDKNRGARGSHLTDHDGVELKTFDSNEQIVKFHFSSELQGLTVAPGSDFKLGGTLERDVNTYPEKVPRRTSSESGTKNTAVCEESNAEAESGRKIAVRSSRLIPELSSLSEGSVKVGTSGAGFLPRTPKRKLELVSNIESRKKLKTDAQGTPAFGEVIDDSHRGEAFSKLQKHGLLQSPAIMGSTPSSTSLKMHAEIMKLKLKLHNTALRRDHLGTDDIGRNYWALSGPKQASMLVVSECDVIAGAEFERTEESVFSYVEHNVRNDDDRDISQDHSVDKTKVVKTRWWAYQNDASIDSLLAWLNPRVEVELALKTSICNWRKSLISKFHELLQEKQSNNPLENLTDGALKKEPEAQISKVIPKKFPALQATAILQMRHGSASSLDRIVPKRALLAMGERVIRCSCLEPLLKFKRHCQACHETYESTVELESHKSVCPSSAGTDSFHMKNQKATEKGNNSGFFEKDQKRKSTSPMEETELFSEREDIYVLSCEKNVCLSLEFSEPIVQRHAARSKTQPPHCLESDDANVIGNWAASEEPVEDAFFLSDFQDDTQNMDVDDVEAEDLRMGFGSFSSLLQDDEWEANERSELKRKKPGSGKKTSKKPLIQGAREMTLANFDYASLPMNFSTPDSTRGRILQIGCIADQGPTFAPALHFAPAFDLSLMIKPFHPVFNVNDVQGVEFPGSSPPPSSLNDSSTEELNPKDFVEGGLDAVSWYDPQTSGEVPPDLIFASEILGLPILESDKNYVSHTDGGCALEVDAENIIITNDEMQPGCTPNTNRCEKDSLSGTLELRYAVNATEVETVSSFDKLRPTSDLEHSDLVPFSALKTQPLPNLDVPLATVVIEAPAVVPNSITMKKPSKFFAVPEPSLRPLVGEQYGVLVGIKMRLLDMEAAMGVDILIPIKSAPARRRAWRSLVKSALCIYEMTKSVILLEQMVRADCLKRTWCYWSSLSAAARSATLSTLALRIFAFDSAIMYKKEELIADDTLRSSTVKKSKKIPVQVPFSSNKKKVNRIS
ncbi:methyl-CpG-binding domain-containing protein 9 isoform X3 [Physcomitrium patens]|uniref:methyl-CpG-binding domain-containing protein 9 isoform X3 n=1 Tax=Physcomitrium patens TaxID=3218 RepID=UPI003CCCB10D